MFLPDTHMSLIPTALTMPQNHVLRSKHVVKPEHVLRSEHVVRSKHVVRFQFVWLSGDYGVVRYTFKQPKFRFHFISNYKHISRSHECRQSIGLFYGKEPQVHTHALAKQDGVHESNFTVFSSCWILGSLSRDRTLQNKVGLLVIARATHTFRFIQIIFNSFDSIKQVHFFSSTNCIVNFSVIKFMIFVNLQISSN